MAFGAVREKMRETGDEREGRKNVKVKTQALCRVLSLSLLFGFLS